MKTLIIIMLCTFFVQSVWLLVGELTRAVPDNENFISNPYKWVFGKQSWQNAFRAGVVFLFAASCVEIWLLLGHFMTASGINLFIFALIGLFGSMLVAVVAQVVACFFCAVAVLFTMLFFK